jgi:hypothetical protein
LPSTLSKEVCLGTCCGLHPFSCAAVFSRHLSKSHWGQGLN